MFLRYLIPFATLVASVQAACGVPVMTLPTSAATMSTRVESAGYTTDDNCRKICLFLDGQNIGCDDLAGAGETNGFTRSDILTAGTHTMYVSVTGPDPNNPTGPYLPQVASDPVTFTITLPIQCPPPVILTPSNGAALSSRQISVTGTFAGTTGCPDVAIYFSGIYMGLASVSGTNFELSAYAAENVGTSGSYSITALAKAGLPNFVDSAYGGSTSSFTITHTCGVPVMTLPTSAATMSTRVESAGYTTDAVCNKIFLWLDGRIIGYDYLRGAGATNGFTRSDVLTAGTHTMYVSVTGPGPNGQDLPQVASAPFTFTITPPVACPAPFIVAPASGAVVNSRDITVSGTFAGTAECHNVALYLSGIYLGLAGVSGTDFTLPVYAASNIGTNGNYRITAVAKANAPAFVDSAYADSTSSFTLQLSACPPPVILTPTTGTVQSENHISITGTFVPSSACPIVSVFINGRDQGYARTNGNSFVLDAYVNGGGAYTVSVKALSTDSPSLDSTPVTSNVAVIQACPTPSILIPSGNTNQDSRLITVSGTTTGRADCPNVDMFVDGIAVTRSAVSAGSFSATYELTSDGAHEIYVVSRSIISAMADSPASIVRTITVSSPITPCPAPVLTSPIDDSAQNGQAILITGTAGGGSNCPAVSITVDGQVTVVPIGNGAFTMSQPVTTDGAHTVSVITSSNSATAYDSPPVTVTVRTYPEPCPAPVLISPRAGETSTTSIFFSGTLDNRPECGKIEVYMDGVLIYTTATNTAASGRRKRAVSTFSFEVPTADLPSGSHNIYAVVTGDNNGVQTEPVPIIVRALADPVPTGSLSRRKNRCSALQTLCPFKFGGRLGFECIDDIDSNLERCGACDGPDCTEIPNASDVACVQSQCIVSSCLEGFVLQEDNTCVEESDGFILQE